MRFPMLAAAALALPALALAQTPGQQAPARHLTPVLLDSMAVATSGRRLVYGADSLQYGELRLPEGRGRFPVVVLVHGGCWLARLGGYAPTLRLMEPLADALRADGIATWNVAYRRIDEPGGGWPGTFTDVGAAVDFVRVLARRFPLDTSRVIVVGHSSGAQLALWAAGRQRLPPGSALRSGQPLRMRGVVALAGPPDMLAWVAAGLDQRICGERVGARLFGVWPDTSAAAMRARAPEGSPAELLPMHVAQRLVVGTIDRVVPSEMARAYEARGRAAGDDVRYIAVEGASHFDYLAPAGIGWSATHAAILGLLAGAARH